jgi:hypothetical protein
MNDFLGETVTAPAENTKTGLLVGLSVLIAGGIGAGVGHVFSKPSNRARYQKNGAIAGSVAAGTLYGAFASAPIMCGLFSSKDEQDQIDQMQNPTRALGALGCGTAALAGGFLGPVVFKKHPTMGALAGAALGSGVVMGLVATQGCPKLPQKAES